MAKLLVDDELWAIVEPLLPKWTPNPKGGQPRKPDRLCLSGILFGERLVNYTPGVVVAWAAFQRSGSQWSSWLMGVPGRLVRSCVR